MKKSKVYLLALLLSLFMLFTDISYAISLDQEAPVAEMSEEEALIWEAEPELIHESPEGEGISMEEEFDTRGETGISVIHRSELSAFLREVGRMFVYLKERGIKVNKIEVVQDGRTLIRTYNVDSYSTVGRYEMTDFKILEPFRYTDGANRVIVNFYGNEVLVASYPYTFQIVRKPMSDDIRVGLVDERGSLVSKVWTTYDKIYFNWNGSVKVTADMIIRRNLIPGERLYPYITVNGNVVDVSEWYRSDIHENYQLKVTHRAKIVSCPIYRKYPPSLKLGVINADRFRNVRIEFWQDDHLTGTTDDYSIQSNFVRNLELTKYMDIPLSDRYFARPGDQFLLKIYNDEELLFEKELLPKKDQLGDPQKIDTWLVEDGLDPEAKVMPIIRNVSTDKIFKVRFSDPIDISSFSNHNLYMVDKETKRRIQLNFDKLKLERVGDKYLDVYEMSVVASDYYRPGQMYFLVLEPGIRSIDGKVLSKQVVLYFTVEQ